MAGIKDVRVRVRLSVLSDLIRDKGDLDQRPGKAGPQRHTIIDIPEMEMPSDELSTRLEYAVLVLQDAMSVSGAHCASLTTEGVSNLTHNSVKLHGHVDPYSAMVATIVTFQYGLTKALGTTVAAAESPLATAAKTHVTRDLAGLTPETKYYYRVCISDANYPGGKCSIIKSFVTDEAP